MRLIKKILLIMMNIKNSVILIIYGHIMSTKLKIICNKCSTYKLIVYCNECKYNICKDCLKNKEMCIKCYRNKYKYFFNKEEIRKAETIK